MLNEMEVMGIFTRASSVRRRSSAITAVVHCQMCGLATTDRAGTTGLAVGFDRIDEADPRTRYVSR